MWAALLRAPCSLKGASGMWLGANRPSCAMHPSPMLGPTLVSHKWLDLWNCSVVTQKYHLCGQLGQDMPCVPVHVCACGGGGHGVSSHLLPLQR